MNLRASIAVVCLALSLGACGAPPESRVALSEPGEAAYDARLLGKWYWGEEDGAYYFHITPRKDSAALDFLGVGVGYGEGNPVRWLQAVVHASDIDGVTYYSAKRVAGADYTAEGEQPGYILLRMLFDRNERLTLCFLGGVWGGEIDDLVDEGLIAGRKVKGSYGTETVPYTVIDMARPALVALIREAGPERLFSCSKGWFSRLSPSKETSD